MLRHSHEEDPRDDPDDLARREGEASGSRPSPRRRRLEPLPPSRAPAKLERQEKAPPQAPDEEQGDQGKRARRGLLRRRPFASVSGVILAAAAMGGGFLWWDHSSRFETTDDAFVASRQIAIAPKVAGYVTQVPVTDNQHVAKGETIARIDERDYRTALDQADAQVESAKAAIENVGRQIAVQQAQVEASQAQADQAQASLVFAKQQADRYQTLAHSGFGSVQNAQQYNSQLGQQEAAVKSAQAAVAVARRQIDALKAQRASAEASLKQAEAQRDQAKLNLSYTDVTAAEPGRIVNLTAAPGEFAQAGTNLTMFVPDEIWVTANFKETQLDAMRPGQPATLSLDAYPERAIRGHVESVQPGSGTAFSLLPVQNATGNYVKVVQRVPVKIVIDNPPSDIALGPGMSVVPSVRVDASLSHYERLSAWLQRLWRKP